ncbi:MAG: hypothetical protein QF685_07675 [Verrucomicrobiota bacterium]|jgi:hypothetical protein|nr:hypothetical protein [Verrucomicrobiota bacterium]
MTDARILPDLQCSLLCEDIRQEANGNPILIGILSQLVVPQLPVTAFKIVCFNRWAAGVGKFTEHTKIIMPDQSTVLRENKMEFDLDRPENSRTNVHLFGNVEFKEPGVYQIEVNVDDVLKLRYPFPIVLVPPKDASIPEGNAGQ